MAREWSHLPGVVAKLGLSAGPREEAASEVVVRVKERSNGQDDHKKSATPANVFNYRIVHGALPFGHVVVIFEIVTSSSRRPREHEPFTK